ncbi:MAG: SpoIVB peptidase [Desulfotomaculales bacterium]
MPCFSIKRVHVLFFLILLISGVFSPYTRSLASLPAYQTAIVGEPLSFTLSMPPTLRKHIALETNRPGFLSRSGPASLPLVRRPGECFVHVKLFGVIPLRQVAVSAYPPVRVIPGGQAIGVLLRTQGVIVVGSAPVSLGNEERSPALEAGMHIGDVIIRIDRKSVTAEEDVREAVDAAGRAGRALLFEVKRGNRTLEVKVRPQLCPETRRYRVGILVRDSTAGVGTMTFCEPRSKTFGALGHIIADTDTSQGVEVAGGKIVEATIQAVRPGRRGQPGEKVGIFYGDGGPVGHITSNTGQGIFGTLEREITNPLYPRPIPVALVDQVRPGPAEMLTVLRGRRIEKFSVEIVRVRPGVPAEGKNLVIRITDRRLLREAGGIVQGMSGSPIVQRGRLAGAVTHVFVNNPTRGYGIPAESMLRACGLLRSVDASDRSSANVYQEGGIGSNAA